ncbi:hypothetical protein OS493_002263 [Desmophyllum pertusum]|uniref:Uncharacterized protein n=1 Tax=Desmophyllum pertusum TaxID=174260 RepID=A0A9W9Z8J5_9CNID|nr:hypothetical protein OS493_002263 [Desmophyllum pertusum]
MNSKHVAELENLKLLMSKQLEETGQEVDKTRQEKFDKFKQIYDSEVNALKEALDKQITLKNDLQQQMEKMKEELDIDVAQARESVTQKEASLEELKGQLKELKASSATEISELRNELKKKEKEINELEDNLSSFEEEHTSDVAQFEHNLQKQQEQTAELEKQLVLELGNESSKYDQKLSETKAHLESQYKKAIHELVQRVKDLESENENLQATHGQEMEGFRENLAQYTSGLEEQMQELQAGARAEHKSKLKALQAEHLEATRNLEKKVRTLSEEKDALVVEIKTRGDGRTGEEDPESQSEEVARLKGDYEEQIQTLKEQAQHEKERLEKEVAEVASTKEKEFMAVFEQVLEKHQHELAEVKGYYELQLSERGGGHPPPSGEEDLAAQLKLEKDREISQLKKKLLQESEERIASAQEALLYKMAKEEEENIRLRNKLANLNEDLSEVTGERDRLLNEIQVLTDTHRVLEQRMAPVESMLSPVSSQLVHEEPLLMQESADALEVLPDAGFTEAASGQSDLTAKLNQMQELVRQKNKVEVKLSQQLQDTKKELEKERESFRAEINERETRERALEVGKRQLEAQLTVVDSENYESLQELALLQERLEERNPSGERAEGGEE